jgi:hypothetical protein
MKSVSVGLVRLRKRVRQYAETVPALAPIPAMRGLAADLLERLRLLSRRSSRDDRTATAVSSSVSMLMAGLGAVVLATVITGIRPESRAQAAWAAPGGGMASTNHPAHTIRPTTGGTPAARQLPSSAPSATHPTPQQAVDYVVGGLLTPGAKATQDDGIFTDLAPSPEYARDGTVYASGLLVNGCLRPSCTLLFASADHGATWRHLPAASFGGGRLLVAGISSGDQVLFASTPTGLQRSDDRGQSFTTVAPVTGPAALAPTPDAMGQSILIGSSPMWWYSAGTGRLSSGPSLPLGTNSPDDVAFAGDRDHILVAASRMDPLAGSLQDDEIIYCEPVAGCQAVLSAPDTGPFHLSPSPTVASDHTIFANAAHTLYVSRDGGRSFHLLKSDQSGVITALGIDPGFASSGNLEVGFAPTAAGSYPYLLGSLDGGTSFVRLSGLGLPDSHSMAYLLQLPDNRLLGALNGSDPSGFFGIRCSSDRGRTWKSGC